MGALSDWDMIGTASYGLSSAIKHSGSKSFYTTSGRLDMKIRGAGYSRKGHKIVVYYYSNYLYNMAFRLNSLVQSTNDGTHYDKYCIIISTDSAGSYSVEIAKLQSGSGTVFKKWSGTDISGLQLFNSGWHKVEGTIYNDGNNLVCSLAVDDTTYIDEYMIGGENTYTSGVFGLMFENSGASTYAYIDDLTVYEIE